MRYLNSSALLRSGGLLESLKTSLSHKITILPKHKHAESILK
jgi:hypothetical protein